MENQVLNISQMQHLKELGVDTSKASMVILLKDEDGCELYWDEVQIDNDNEKYPYCPVSEESVSYPECANFDKDIVFTDKPAKG